MICTEIINEIESSSSEDDADAVLLTEEVERGFLKVLSHLKERDLDLYSGNGEYFSSDNFKQDEVIAKSDISYQQAYKDWLKGHIKKIKDRQARKDLKGLHNFWTNPAITKDDQFLRDYILNKQFLDPDDSFCLEKELENLSEEEKEEEEQAIFEEKYNCRFESPDNKFFEKFPQTMKKALGRENSAIVTTTKETNKEKEGIMLKSASGNKSLKKQHFNNKRKSDENLTNLEYNGKEIGSNQHKKKLKTHNVSLSDQKQKNINATESKKNTKEIKSDDSKNVEIGRAEYLKKIVKTEPKSINQHYISKNKVNVDKIANDNMNLQEVFDLLKVKKMGKDDKRKWRHKKFKKFPQAMKNALEKEKSSAIVTTTKESDKEKEGIMLKSVSGNKPLKKQHFSNNRKSDENLTNLEYNGTEIMSNQQNEKLKTHNLSFSDKKQKNIHKAENKINRKEIKSYDSKNVKIGKADHLKKILKTEPKSKNQPYISKNRVKVDKIALDNMNLQEVFDLLKVNKLRRDDKRKWRHTKFKKFPQTMKNALEKENSCAIVTTPNKTNKEKEGIMLKSVSGNESLKKHNFNNKRKSDENLTHLEYNGTTIESNQQKKKLKTHNLSFTDKKQKNFNTTESKKIRKEIKSDDSKNLKIGKAEHLRNIIKTEHLRKIIETEPKSKNHHIKKNQVKVDKIALNNMNLKVFNLVNMKKLGKHDKQKWNYKQKIKQPRTKNFNKVKTANKEGKENFSKGGRKRNGGKRKPRHRALKWKSVS